MRMAMPDNRLNKNPYRYEERETERERVAGRSGEGSV